MENVAAIAKIGPMYREWLAERLAEKGHGAKKALAEFMGLDGSAVSRMLVEGGRQISADELAKMVVFFGSAPPGASFKAEAERYAEKFKARMLGPTRALAGEGKRIPVYGQAIGGLDGRFVLNGNEMFDVIAPASLSGVPNAYAVMVVGDSMEPRYHSGEVAYVHPGLPVRRGDYVVAQIVEDEHEPPSAFVKQFVSLTENGLTLEQLNPKRAIKFTRPIVKSVHRIILAGDP